MGSGRLTVSTCIQSTGVPSLVKKKKKSEVFKSDHLAHFIIQTGQLTFYRHLFSSDIHTGCFLDDNS